MAVTAESIDAAMREVLPHMEAASVTLKLVMDALANKFDVDVKELKAQWKPVIKSKVLDLIVLCPGYEEQPEDKENVDTQQDDEGEEEEEKLSKPRRSHAVAKKRRNTVSDESDAQDNDESEAEPSESAGDAESDDEDEAPRKRRRVSVRKLLRCFGVLQ